MEEEVAKLTQQVEKQQQKVQILQEEVKDSLSIPEQTQMGRKGFAEMIKNCIGKGRLEMIWILQDRLIRSDHFYGHPKEVCVGLGKPSSNRLCGFQEEEVKVQQEEEEVQELVQEVAVLPPPDPRWGLLKTLGEQQARGCIADIAVRNCGSISSVYWHAIKSSWCKINDSVVGVL